MQRQVAFLRAVNVGGRVVKMERVKALFEGLGYIDVVPFLASGNILFSTDQPDRAAVEAAIEDTLAHELGYAVPTFVRDEAQLRALADAQPFAANELQDDIVTYVSFLKTVPSDAAINKLHAIEDQVITFVVEGDHVHWLRRRHLGDSEITNGDLEKALGVDATRRNMNTIHRLIKKF